MEEKPPVLMPGDNRWRVADALEWLRRQGIEGVHHRRESHYYVFFEKFEDHWGNKKTRFEEKVIAEPEEGVQVVYRTYATRLQPDKVLDPREVAGGQRLVRCFKFFHDQKNYGPAFRGEVPFGQREPKTIRGEFA